jgi:epoxyqueuosine reductase
MRAGIAWLGKNTAAISPEFGSWVFLGEILTTLDLEPDPPLETLCGKCTRCIDACPTGALDTPFVLDARRCISYLTIEHAGPIPRELREPIGVRIFGCDDCQEACPWNRFATPTYEPDFTERPAQRTPWLLPLLDLDRDGFGTRFAGTPLMRAGRDLIVRNAAVALGNLRDPRAVPALARAAAADPSPLVRGHAAWALGRIGGTAAREALAAARGQERDAGALAEVRAAIEASGGG